MKQSVISSRLMKPIILIIIVFSYFTPILKAQNFPLRKKYPNVKTISTKELAEELGKSLIVVDARNKVEYDVIHIKGAVNNKIGHVSFDKKLEKITNGDKNAKIAFYCNGGMCKKSFKAALEAQKLGYTNVFSYDAGIFEWAKANPARTYLLGKILNDKSRLISKEEFASKLLSKAEFEKESGEANALLIDVRDPAQKERTPNFSSKALESSMDKFAKILKQKYFKDKVGTKTLYIFDAVGKQVKWLQYYLKENNYDNYYFLKGGVKAYFK